MPLAIAALITGLLQATLLRWGLARYWWTVIKLVITIVVTLVVILTLYPRLAGAAGTALGRPGAQALTDSQRVRIASSWPAVSALVLVNVFLGAFKPGWHLRSRRGREEAKSASLA